MTRSPLLVGIAVWVLSGILALTIGVLGITGVLFHDPVPGYFMTIGGAGFILIGAAGVIRNL